MTISSDNQTVSPRANLSANPSPSATSSAIQVLVHDISNAALDPAEALAFVSDDAFGGIDMFIGRVRRQSHGRLVTGIHYDMFEPLALNVFVRAAEAAIASFGPALKVYVAHAKGRLAIGDLAVIIAVGSPHRDEAFRACREVIETVKHQAPIWKQEHFVDGASAWSEGCTLCGKEHVAMAPTVAPSTGAPPTDSPSTGAQSLHLPHG